MNTSHHITVKFEGDGVPIAAQGPLLLALEREARRLTGKPVEVFKEIMADDSKLRLMGQKRRREMSDEERNTL